jgi:hypothetical protein
MIHVDGSQDGNQGINDIRGVQAATETSLKDDEINALAPKIVEGQCRGNFEKCGMALLIYECTYPLDTPDELCIVNRHAVDPDSLAKPNEVRRGEEPGFESGGPANGVNHRTDRSLAIGTCDMDKAQCILRFSQGRQEGSDVLKTEFDASILSPEQPIDRGAVRSIHLGLQQLKSPVQDS